MRLFYFSIAVSLLLIVALGCERNPTPSSRPWYGRLCEISGQYEAKTNDGWEVLLEGDGTEVHRWRAMSGRVFPRAVKTGQVVLVRAGSAYGAFVFLDQNDNPESATFESVYRSDGDAVLDHSLNRKRGSGNSIVVGPLTLDWSINIAGSGWIYYPKSQDINVEICVTTLSDWNGVMASDDRWIYLSLSDVYPLQK